MTVSDTSFLDAEAQRLFGASLDSTMDRLKRDEVARQRSEVTVEEVDAYLTYLLAERQLLVARGEAPCVYTLVPVYTSNTESLKQLKDQAEKLGDAAISVCLDRICAGEHFGPTCAEVDAELAYHLAERRVLVARGLAKEEYVLMSVTTGAAAESHEREPIP